MTNLTNLDEFTQAYLEAALWSSTDGDGTPLDSEHCVQDIVPETLQRMIVDCEKFQRENADAIAVGAVNRRETKYSAAGQAGHDFWLTRNGHGAGFWDGDWPEPSATVLTKAAHAFGEFALYIGNDGKIDA